MILDTGSLREFAFTDANTAAGNIATADAAIHKQSFCEELLRYELETVPDWTFLLDVPHEICYERMKKRDRSNESLLSLAYFKQLEDAHRAAIANPTYRAYIAKQDCQVLSLEQGEAYIQPYQIIRFVCPQ